MFRILFELVTEYKNQTYGTIGNIKLFSASLTVISESNQNKVYKGLAAKQIKWDFGPPASAWMNGAMEAIVKITKKAVKTVVRDSLFAEEMLATYLTEIESLINGRRLMPISDDVNDMDALTPNHVLLGRISVSIFPSLHKGKIEHEHSKLSC